LRSSLLRRILKPRGTASEAKSDSYGGQQYCQHAFHDSYHIFSSQFALLSTRKRSRVGTAADLGSPNRFGTVLQNSRKDFVKK
jgi:hypothetical protein